MTKRSKTDRLVDLAEQNETGVLNDAERAELTRLAKDVRADVRSALKWRDETARTTGK